MRPDASVIGHMEGVYRYYRRREDAYGPRTIQTMVHAQREMVTDLLADCPPQLRPRLLALRSQIATSIGFYCFERRDLVSARHYFGEAHAAAVEGDDQRLIAYALANQSYVEASHGNALAAIHAANVAQDAAAKSGELRLRALVEGITATAYATARQRTLCLTACDEAQRHLPDQDGDSTDAPWDWYGGGARESQLGNCLLHLGMAKEAAESAATALDRIPRWLPRSQIVCMTRLANARVACDEPQEAARHIVNAAALTYDRQSQRLTHDLRTCRRRLQPWASTDAVRNLDDQLAAMG